MDVLKKYKNDVDKLCAGLDKSEKRKIALMCLERQFKTYEQFAYNREWGRVEEYRELLNECWQAILCDVELGEEIWEKHEEIKPEYVNNRQEEYATIEFVYANIFAGNIEEFLETLLDDKEGEESFLLFNIDFIISYISENRVVFNEDISNTLIGNEKRNQMNDIKEQKKIKSMEDVADWCAQVKNLVFMEL